MKQNVLFQGVPTPGNESPWLTVVGLAWGEAGTLGLVAPSWVVGAPALALEVIRASAGATAALSPATHRAQPAIIASLGQKTHPLREPGGQRASPRGQRNHFLIPVSLQLTSLSLGFVLWYHPMQDRVAGMRELDFTE